MFPRPFIKWAGGKTQLLTNILRELPAKIPTYYEPFMGGAAVFFALAAEGRIQRAVLNDWNKELVETYETVRDEPDALIEALTALKARYTNDAEGTFAQVRASEPETKVARAARMIFLNKTCFNGLYRVNRAGKFNVPFGKFKNPGIFDAELLRACSQALHNVEIHNGDFADCVKSARLGDVAYFDPPYVPVSVTANFTSYTAIGFSMADQERLATLFGVLSDRGVHVLLSNADVASVRDLYRDFQIVSVQVKRQINSKADRRGPVGEVIVLGSRKAQDEPRSEGGNVDSENDSSGG